MFILTITQENNDFTPLENWKFNSPGGVEEILFNTLK